MGLKNELKISAEFEKLNFKKSDTPTAEEFPVLYGEASTGKAKQWRVHIVKNADNTASIITEYGYVGMKIQTAMRVIEKGKNIGKTNETDAYSQALSEARSKWTKKTEEGYQTNTPILSSFGKADTTASASTTTVKKILPMLALNWTDRSHNIAFPCFVQPKLDGVRCLFNSDKHLYSRNAKEFTSISHISDELANSKNIPGILDGEMYSTEITFQELVGLAKKKKLTKADSSKILKIKFVVYDIVSNDDYHIRNEKLQKFFDENNFKYIELVKTETAKNISEIQVYHDKYVSEGFEGLIIRNKKGAYVEKNRSKNLQKFKMFVDQEYKIVGFTDGEGAEKGCIIYTCVTSDGKEFSVRPTGTREDRKKLFKIGQKFVGTMLTVKFQELSTDGVPRFPVGIAIRDFE